MSYTCPVCSRTSHHPCDEREGYCAICHTWTRDCRCEWRTWREEEDDSVDRWYLAIPAIDCPQHGASYPL